MEIKSKTSVKKRLPINRDEVVDFVRQTSDYSKFKPFKGQRPCEGLRLTILIEVLKILGGIISPIVVNEFFQIVDGVGRFTAAKRNNMPIRYIIVPGADIDTFTNMNRSQRNLSAVNFINAFAQWGKPAYKELERFVLQHSIPVTAGVALLSGKGAHGDSLHGFRRGEFKITTRKLADETVAYAHDLKNYLPYAYTRNMLYAIRDGIVNEWYNHDNVMQRLSTLTEVPYIPGSTVAATLLLQEFSALKTKTLKKAA